MNPVQIILPLAHRAADCSHLGEHSHNQSSLAELRPACWQEEWHPKGWMSYATALAVICWVKIPLNIGQWWDFRFYLRLTISKCLWWCSERIFLCGIICFHDFYHYCEVMVFKNHLISPDHYLRYMSTYRLAYQESWPIYLIAYSYSETQRVN